MSGNPLMDLRRLDEEKRAKTVLSSPKNETNVTTLQDYNEEDKEELNGRSIEEYSEEAPELMTEASRTQAQATKPNRTRARTAKAAAEQSAASTAASSPSPPVDSREERLTAALHLAQEDEPVVVTIRVSPRLNAYIDRYVQRINQVEPKRKYRKQDAVAEAFAAFYADHIMPPALMDEDGL